MKKNILFILTASILSGMVLSGCALMNRIHPAAPTETFTPAVTETPAETETPTPPPSAAVVNGAYIWKDDYDSALFNVKEADQELGKTDVSESDQAQEALDSLINETLFLSEAQKEGIAPDAAAIDQRVQALADKMGGMDKLQEWERNNHYTEDGFRRSIERELAAGRVKKKLTADKLNGIEQVHVYEILNQDQATANQVKQNLDSGADFLETAKKYNAETGGDLGWFPRGVLLDASLEDPIFNLQVGKYSDVIQSKMGFYIFYLAERSTDHALDSQVQQILERSLLSSWIADQRKSAQITDMR